MDPSEETKPTPANNQATETTSATTSVPPAPSKPKTEEIDVTKLTQEDANTISVDWGNPAAPKGDDLFAGPTKPIPNGTPPPGAPKPGPVTPIDPSKFKTGIKVMVLVIDFVLSNILYKIAGDGTASSYTADKPSRENLEEALCLLLEERQKLVPTWLVVLFAFLAAYGFQIMAAIQVRQKRDKPQTIKIASNDSMPMEPGLFKGTDGKMYRRYRNGSVKEAQFDESGKEKIIGQPSRRK